MTPQEAELLLKKYIRGDASPQEKALLENWYYHQLNNRDFTADAIDIEALKDEIWQEVRRKSGLAAPVTRRRRTRYPLVAAVVVAVGLAAYFQFISPQAPSTYTVAELNGHDIDIKPGSNRATLTLADGRVINLSDDKEGIVIDVNALTYADGTEVVADAGPADAAGLSTAVDKKYNILTTPKGGQYRVVLPDGSRVWLNAVSTLKYPNRFDPDERTVELIGEAYFEIAPVKSADNRTATPFLVKSSKQTIEVLGTHFNVSTYEDDPLATTTLFEGSVQVVPVGDDNKVKLTPGQQSIVQEGMNTKIQEADLEKALGWKNGEFVFYGESIENVMKGIARWYDVEVIYKRPVQQKVIWGAISRFENISEVLKMIELTGVVRFDIQIHERRVYVMN